jgi:chromosome segregation ATPase
VERGPLKTDLHAPCHERIAELEAALAAQQRLTHALLKEYQELKARLRALEHRSLRKQGRAILEFIAQAVIAFRTGRRAPSLLPDPGG